MISCKANLKMKLSIGHISVVDGSREEINMFTLLIKVYRLSYKTILGIIIKCLDSRISFISSSSPEKPEPKVSFFRL